MATTSFSPHRAPSGVIAPCSLPPAETNRLLHKDFYCHLYILHHRSLRMYEVKYHQPELNKLLLDSNLIQPRRQLLQANGPN